MENQKSKLTAFREIIQDLIDAKLGVAKLSVIEFLSLFFASLFSMFIVGVFLVLALIFGAIGFAAFLNGLLESTFLGYFISSGVFLGVMVTLIVMSSKKGQPYFIDTFVRLFVTLFYNDNEED